MKLDSEIFCAKKLLSPAKTWIRRYGNMLPYSLVEHLSGVHLMSKGMERKKEDKKKPAKTLDEKRAAKRAKKEGKNFA
jgi:hypothetical protein